MELRLCLLLLLVRVSASEESGEGAGYTLGDYLPMYKLTTSRSAAENTGATKSLFYDFLPSELGGKKANHLEVRSLYSVSQSANSSTEHADAAVNCTDSIGLNKTFLKLNIVHNVCCNK